MNFSEAIMALSFGKTIAYRGNFLIRGKTVKAPKTHIIPLFPLEQPIFIYDDYNIKIWIPSQEDFFAKDYEILKPVPYKTNEDE
jgi:hypothetical protein